MHPYIQFSFGSAKLKPHTKISNL